jgi:AraC-like DNA-binding protein
MTVVGTGHFVSWEGGCLLIGHATAVTPQHAHYAIQVAFGVEHGIRFRTSDRDPWVEYDGVLISSRHPHTMDASCVPFNVVLFVEPETPEGRALIERFGDNGITALPAAVFAEAAAALFTTWHERRGATAVAAAGKEVVRALTGGVQPSVVSDERILRATSYIRHNIDRSLTLEEVAGEACLSPSRFRHLFVEQTGMALRPYILWRRFIHVWELLMAGSSLSSAAHAAGFADAAHLSRTSKRMFGFPPSGLHFTGPLGGANQSREAVAR